MDDKEIQDYFETIVFNVNFVKNYIDYENIYKPFQSLIMPYEKFNLASS